IKLLRCISWGSKIRKGPLVPVGGARIGGVPFLSGPVPAPDVAMHELYVSVSIDIPHHGQRAIGTWARDMLPNVEARSSSTVVDSGCRDDFRETIIVEVMDGRPIPSRSTRHARDIARYTDPVALVTMVRRVPMKSNETGQGTLNDDLWNLVTVEIP